MSDSLHRSMLQIVFILKKLQVWFKVRVKYIIKFRSNHYEKRPIMLNVAVVRTAHLILL
jgi:hypothetical protein